MGEAEEDLDSGEPLIVVAKDAPKVEQIAAYDLKAYLSKITGRSIALTDDAIDLQGSTAKKIFVVGTSMTNSILNSLVQEGLVTISEDILGPQGMMVKTLKFEGKDLVMLAGYASIGSMYAVYDFLENFCGVGFFPDGDKIPQRDALDFGEIDYIRRPRFRYRMYHNHPNWSRPFVNCVRLWPFEEWKKLIDWMRKKRLNVLVLFHDEGTYLWGDAIFSAFPEIKKSEENLARFVMMPDYRTELNKRIFQYAGQNGISICYNLMYSQVPDFFQKERPDLTYHRLWMECSGICAAQKECKEIMRKFWGEIIRTYAVDGSHLYIICPYQHEKPLCNNFATRAEPTLQAYEVLKDIDPESKIFVENWCWTTDYHPEREWEDFKKLPEGIGVLNADLGTSPAGEGYERYKSKDWLQWIFLTMEGTFPPSLMFHSIEDIMFQAKQADIFGACGLLAFNIIANSNELLCNLIAELGWTTDLDKEKFLEKYVRLRFGKESYAIMLESFRSYLKCLDRRLLLACMPAANPAEADLVKNIKQLGEGNEWVENRLNEFRSKRDFVEEAIEIALIEENHQKDNKCYRKYLEELEYIKARWNGIISFYKAYIYSHNPTIARGHFEDALKYFYEIKEIYRKKKECSMSKLKELAPDVEYNPYFLENWDRIDRRWDSTFPYYNIVWEHFHRYEENLRNLALKLGIIPH